MTASTSQHRSKVVLNGKVYIVEVEALDGTPLHVTVNGVRREVEVEQLECHPPAAPAPGFQPGASSGRESSGMAALVREVRSPMPGTILEIAVTPGDRVCLGQTLCFLEAMKMKNAIRSPRDGVIASVLMDESQLVGHGDVLVTFE